MGLTYVDTSMIEQPTNFTQLSAGTLLSTNLNVESLSVNNITNSPSIIGNLTVYGTITALSGFNIVIASTTSTSALSVSNIQASPALNVYQGPASSTIAVFKNNTGDVININNTGLTVNGIVSGSTIYSTGGNSNFWNTVGTIVQTNSATWEESAEILPTVTNYLSTSNVRISALVNGITISGSISGNNLTTSFNLGSAAGDYSFAEGINTIASGRGSHAEGASNIASGDYAHTEGGSLLYPALKNIASGTSSHAEGQGTWADGSASHTEGYGTSAIGLGSHAQGLSSIALGDYSHAAGWRTYAEGIRSYTTGQQTSALATTTYAHGRFAVANKNRAWVWQGTPTENRLFFSTRNDQFALRPEGGLFLSGSMGINTDSIANALTISGNVSATGTVTTSALNIVSNIVFPKTTFNNLVSALAININGITLYMPLLSAL